MPKLFRLIARDSFIRIAVLCGLLALVAVPPVATALSGDGKQNGLNAAQMVIPRPAKAGSRVDRDRDGLSNWAERNRTKTNPYRFDTDRDGFGDGAEVAAGSNPRDPKSVPTAPPPPPGPVGPLPPVTPPSDTTPPETAIESGPAATTTSTSASFGFSSSEADSSFQCKLDSGSWSSCSGPQSYSSLSIGSHSFSVKATDGAGNVDASPATRAWTVEAPAPPPPPDTTAPDTTISSGPTGTTTSTSASFDFASTESGSSFQCKLDSGSWSSCSGPKSYGSLALGNHTFSVKATDGAGNTDASPATRSWTLEAPAPPPDTTAPETTITSGPTGGTTSTSASFGISSSEGGSSFQCKLDSDAWGGCTSPVAYSSVALGSHTFSVKATDGAGNTDASPATRSWTVESAGGGGGGDCTQTLASGNLSSAISNAAAGAVICLNGGSWSVSLSQVSKSNYVTVQSSSGKTASLGYSIINKSKYIRFQGLKFTGGIEMIGSTNHIEFRDNEFTGEFGIRANGEGASAGTEVTDVVIDGNNIHDIDYTGTQGSAGGYGITLVNGVERFTITDNTIKSVAADYIQSASPSDFTVDHNTFLGPSLVGNHPQEHQDLWQIFGGGDNITFTNNVARNTGTHESLLFQEGSFSNVVIENNLFDHDSRGYTCQLYQSKGLIFRYNTIVGSRWGCLFRDLASSSPGSGYQVDHNIFADTESDVDVSTEGRAGSWGTYDYNVSSDGSANGSHSVRNWSPSWVDTVNYSPKGLPFNAGYSP
jgi:Bacterial TSP3 repeat